MTPYTLFYIFLYIMCPIFPKLFLHIYTYIYNLYVSKIYTSKCIYTNRRKYLHFLLLMNIYILTVLNFMDTIKHF